MIEDREEGEIVDDDFEDISDNSIITPLNTGKSESPKEHLPVISLSSFSDSDVSQREKRIHRRKSTIRKSKCFRKRRCRHGRHTLTHSDSDDYMELDPTLHKQLKAAIQINSEGCHKNSLRSRLIAMTKLDNNLADDIEKSDKDKSDQKASNDEGDDDLIQLRLEALRTAVLNKFEHRKKRKVKDMQGEIDIPKNLETNKENTHSANEIQINKKPCLETVDKAIDIINNTPADEDEDVLRALLLASMSKKITKTIDSNETVNANENKMFKEEVNKMRNNVWPVSVGTQITMPFQNQVHKNQFKTSHPIQLKKIKPIIIRVNDDSDSEESSVKISKNISSGHQTNEIESTVERFLKEQRAKVEAQIGTLIPKPLDTDIKPSAPKRLNEKSGILEKSSVKLLPKVKQLEYHKLLLKLKNAEKKPRIRRLSFKVNSEGKPTGSISKKTVSKNLSSPVKTTMTRADKSPDIKKDARALHTALKQMQTQKNGRLQIEEKYVILTPLIKKINETTTERKKRSQEVKRLLEELNEAKKKLQTTNLQFSSQVKDLITKKGEIDKMGQHSTNKVGTTKDTKSSLLFTSTPKKDLPALDSLETSRISSTIPDLSQPLDEKLIVVNAAEKINNEDSKDILSICDRTSNIPKYISPLDCVKRQDAIDPLAITCPYDIDGNCRDPECTYKHYFK